MRGTTSPSPRAGESAWCQADNLCFSVRPPTPPKQCLSCGLATGEPSPHLWSFQSHSGQSGCTGTTERGQGDRQSHAQPSHEPPVLDWSPEVWNHTLLPWDPTGHFTPFPSYPQTCQSLNVPGRGGLRCGNTVSLFPESLLSALASNCYSFLGQEVYQRVSPSPPRPRSH